MTDLSYQELWRNSALSTMRALEMEPDPWQMEVLTGGHKRLLLNCARQAGKSTTVAALSVLESVGHKRTRVLILAPSLRQSRLLFKTAVRFLEHVGQRFIKNQ